MASKDIEAQSGKIRMAMSLQEAVAIAEGHIRTDDLMRMTVLDLIHTLGPNGVIFTNSTTTSDDDVVLSDYNEYLSRI